MCAIFEITNRFDNDLSNRLLGYKTYLPHIIQNYQIIFTDLTTLLTLFGKYFHNI